MTVIRSRPFEGGFERCSGGRHQTSEFLPAGVEPGWIGRGGEITPVARLVKRRCRWKAAINGRPLRQSKASPFGCFGGRYGGVERRTCLPEPIMIKVIDGKRAIEDTRDRA